jgi:glycerol uptake facilitator-like aquaporin
MVVLFPSKTPGELIHGGYTNITLGWGLGVSMGIYVAGNISGAHLNPAVTVSLAVFRDFPWRKVIPYAIAQTAGAFVAAAPLMIGLVGVAIGMSFGGMHGYPINPARDFGPRLFTAVAGFRNNGLTDGNRTWWVPVVAPLLGGLGGAAVYDWGVRPFLRNLQPANPDQKV